MGYVIIGNSYAAIGAVEAIRRVDRNNKITIISDEPYRCYARPLITFWLGGGATKNMYYRPGSFYKDNNIEPILGVKAVQINVEDKYVLLEDRRRVYFDKLLISTGGKPFVPPIKGYTSETKNVHTFTKWDDAKALLKLSKRHKKAVVIGGGLIGLKASEGLNDTGVETTIVELGQRVLALALDEYSGKIANKRLSDNGIKTITGTTAEEILVNSDNEVTGVVLQNGKRLSCGILVITIGVRPNIELVKHTAIKVERGIVTDKTMQTSVPDIYAAGDVVQSYNVITRREEVIAIVPLAYEQGRVAGFNMAGRHITYEGGIGMNSVEIYGLPIMTMGLTNPTNEEQIEAVYKTKDIYRKLVFEDDRLVGAILVGNVNCGGVLTHIIRSQRNISAFRDRLIKGDILELAAFVKYESARLSPQWML
jgi:NAD(P)H-nitrite reductase large subunit